MPSSYVIGEHFDHFIKAQIGSGRYASASEVIRDALRLLEEQDKLRELRIDELRRLIQEGVVSGSGIPAEEVFAKLRAQIEKVAAEQVG